MVSERCYYEILEVSRQASAEEIKKAYKKLAAANHPDRNPGDQQAVFRFKEASEAFKVLSDPQKRSIYDRHGRAGLSGANGAGFSDVSDIFEAFGDLFEGFGFFGQGQGRSGRGSRARRGEHLRASATIELLEAASGCTHEITIKRSVLCETCHGGGAKPGSSPQTCDYCAGHGQVVQSQGFFRVQTTCPACRGEGRVIRDKCDDCSGAGRKSERVTISVKIPAGVDNGMQLCLRGEGEPGFHGGPRGDLYVDIRVKEHSLFHREGAHLTCQVPITYTQAALGADIEIPILEGRHEFTVPAGTQPSETFKLRGFGMPDPHGGRRGDLFVQIQVEVPRKLGEQEEELLRQLAKLENADVSPHRKSFFEKLKDYFAPTEESANTND